MEYIDRQTGQKEIECVYGGNTLEFLYGNSWSSRWIGTPLAHAVSRLPFISSIYGWWQKQSITKKKIQPFIQQFGVKTEDFLLSPDSYNSFNDFFVRQLKPEARPIAPGTKVAVIPADGRYHFFPDISQVDGFIVKGRRFSLDELLQDHSLANTYRDSSMVMARLCPVDYHRFHFPCSGVPSPAQLMRGALYSVNPIALKKNIHIYTQNKRMLTKITTEAFGEILYMEVGATNVGTIHQTYQADIPCKKGDEKGFFSFGGSALLLFFPKGSIAFDTDLIEHSKSGLEILCRFGESMGRSL